MKKVSFNSMDQGTTEDYDLVFATEQSNIAAQTDRIMRWFEMMDLQTVYSVTILEHGLQSASRAQIDGADEETIVCALLHDIGDILAPAKHSQVAAALLRTHVSGKNAWVFEHHGLFHGYYYFHHFDEDGKARDRYRDHPYYQDYVNFCEHWDQCSFDPNYQSRPLSYFEPMVRRLFAKEPAEFV